MLDRGSPFTVALFATAREDHNLVAALLSQYQRSRFRVEVFASPADAQAAIAERRHDAYVADAGMLEDEGEGRAGTLPHPTALFAAAVASGRPLVVLADEEQDARDEDYVAAGAWDCLAKVTLTPPVLGRTLRRGIEHARQRALEHQRGEQHKMEALARLASGMAHDFNNLLTAMLGYAEMLRESLDPHDLRREDVLEIQRAGERASALTRQLLTFGRRAQAQAPPLDLNAAVEDVEPRLASLARGRVHLDIDRAPDAGRVRVDPARLETLLVNLVSNAVDAMPDGGRVRIETRSVELDTAHAADYPGASAGPHACLSVSDQGFGMTPEVRSHLFEPFFTTKSPGKGAGLGLPVVHGIVHRARGHIVVETEPGRGTTVRVYWPRAT